jgi:hypothetical protein
MLFYLYLLPQVHVRTYTTKLLPRAYYIFVPKWNYVANIYFFLQINEIKSRPGDGLPWLRLFVAFLCPSRRIPVYHIKKWTRTASFQIRSNFPFACHIFIRRYMVWVTEKASLKKLQTETRNTHEKWVVPLVAVVEKKKLKIKYKLSDVFSVDGRTQLEVI